MTNHTILTLLLGTAGIIAAANQIRRRNSHMTTNADNSPVTVRLVDAASKVTEPITVPRVVKSAAAWRAQLTGEQFEVTRAHGTERARRAVLRGRGISSEILPQARWRKLPHSLIEP